jgi:hypothetical protein
MELLPAADDDSPTLIKSVIDDCDYYLVILAGRYGSIEQGAGKSYTHLEHEYAASNGKPAIAIVHADPASLPANKVEGTDDGKKKFEQFRCELRKKNCKIWSSASELTSAVFTGIQYLKRTRPSHGWVRATGIADEQLKDELFRVRREVEILNTELDQSRRRIAPSGIDDLERGRDTTTLSIDFLSESRLYWVSWVEVLRSVLPQTLGVGADEEQIANTLAGLAREKSSELEKDEGPSPHSWSQAVVSRSSFGKVMNQMVALGLVEGTPHRNPLRGSRR